MGEFKDCLLAAIDMCNILKSVLGWDKLSCTDPDNVLDPQIGQFQTGHTDRGGELARGNGSCGGDNGLPDNGGHSGLCPLLSTCVQGGASHPKPPGLRLQPSLPPESGSGNTKPMFLFVFLFWDQRDIKIFLRKCGQRVVLDVLRQQI